MGIIVDNFKLKDLEVLRMYGFSYRRINDSWNYTFVKDVPTMYAPYKEIEVFKIIISNSGEQIEFKCIHNNYHTISVLPIQYIKEGNYQKYIKAVDTFVKNCVTEYRLSCWDKICPNGIF